MGEYMGSRLSAPLDSAGPKHPVSTLKMEAIKKKMQAMKVEKDNACDRVDVCEEACKAARLRASKGEDEVDELMAKARQLETELDLTAERFGIVSLQLEEKEKALAASELEMNALNRRVSGLEEDLEKTEGKMVAAVGKLDKAATASDDSERAKKVFQSKADEDEKRIAVLEKDLKEAREKAEAADNTYDEVAKKLAQAEERAEVGESKIVELEEELRVVATNLKSLEVAEEKANQREKTYKEQIKTLSAKLKQAETRA